MAVITVTYRDAFGHDVGVSDPTLAYIQLDSGDPAFSPYTSTMDAVWGGVSVHYTPAYVGPAPSVAFFTTFRIAASGGPGAIDPVTLVIHGTDGDVILDPNNPARALVLSAPPSPMAVTPEIAMVSDYVGPVAIMALQAHARMAIGGRGLVINVPDADRWRLQRAGMRPRLEQSN